MKFPNYDSAAKTSPDSKTQPEDCKMFNIVDRTKMLQALFARCWESSPSSNYSSEMPSVSNSWLASSFESLCGWPSNLEYMQNSFHRPISLLRLSVKSV